MNHIRVVFDTNVFISSLLRRDSESSIVRSVRMSFSPHVTLILTEFLIRELRASVEKKRLRGRITPSDVERLVTSLYATAELVPDASELVPVVRDRKDDYLIANAVAHDADFLVTGDHDLLAIPQVGRLRIVSPREFAEFAAEQAED